MDGNATRSSGNNVARLKPACHFDEIPVRPGQVIAIKPVNGE